MMLVSVSSAQRVRRRRTTTNDTPPLSKAHVASATATAMSASRVRARPSIACGVTSGAKLTPAIPSYAPVGAVLGAAVEAPIVVTPAGALEGRLVGARVRGAAVFVAFGQVAGGCTGGFPVTEKPASGPVGQ